MWNMDEGWGESAEGDAIWVQGISKAWDPKILLVQPFRFPTLPHTTMSSLFYKRACMSSCRRCSMGSRVLVRLGTPGNGLSCFWTFHWCLTWHWVGILTNGLTGRPTGDDFWPQGASRRPVTPKNGLCRLWGLQQYLTRLWVGLFTFRGFQ